MSPQICLALLVLALLTASIQPQEMKIHGHTINLKKQKPTPGTGPPVKCQQIQCWMKKRFMLLQVDNWDNETRNEWQGYRFNLTHFDGPHIGSWYTREYAARHGLTYRLVSVPGMDRYHARYFMKHYVTQRILEQDETDFLVVLDFDVMVSDFDQDIRCLLEQWGYSCEEDAGGKTPLFLQAQDPHFNPFQWNEWPNGTRVLNVNTGFMVIRNSPRTRDLWGQYIATCTANQTNWGNIWFWDQGYWNKDIRWRMKEHEMVVLPCEQANGFRWVVNHEPGWGCGGRYITHGWMFGKQHVAYEMLRRLMVVWTSRVNDLWQHKEVAKEELFPFLYPGGSSGKKAPG